MNMNKEQIYDAEIAPLMTQIIAICKAHKIALLATFAIPTEEDAHLACSTALLTDEFAPHPEMVEAARLICRRTSPVSPLMITTRDNDGNVVRMDAII